MSEGQKKFFHIFGTYIWPVIAVFGTSITGYINYKNAENDKAKQQPATDNQNKGTN